MKRIIYLIVTAIILCTLPFLLKLSFQESFASTETGTPNYILDTINKTQKMSIYYLSILSYLASFVMVIKTLIELKAYFSNNKEIKEEEIKQESAAQITIIDVAKDTILKNNEKIKEHLPKIKNLCEKINFELKIQEELKTGERSLDLKIINVINKLAELKKNKNLNKNLEKKLIVEKTMTQYLPKIINAYKEVSLELKKEKGLDGLSSYDMTEKQLDILYKGLANIEVELLNEMHIEQKIVERYIENRFFN